MSLSLILLGTLAATASTDACADATRASRELAPLDAYLAGRRLPGIATRGASLSIAAPSSAIVMELPLRVGQPVRAGELLARLHAVALDRELALLNPELAAAAADSAQLEADVQRLTREHERRIAHPDLFAREEREAHAALLAGAQARYVQAQARAAGVALRRRQIEQQQVALELRAPADGVVTRVLTHVGESVIVGAHLLELTPALMLQARFALPPDAIGKIAMGARVCLQAGDASPIAARISYVSATTDPAAQAIIAEAIADANVASATALLPGSALDVVPLIVTDATQ